MIGLVVTKPAVQTIAGVKPLSMAKVWAIKVPMLLWHNMFQINMLIVILGLTVAFAGAGWYVNTGSGAWPARILLGFSSLVCGLTFVNVLGSVIKPWNHAHWDTMPFRSWDFGRNHRRIPDRVFETANKVQNDLGIIPQIEYMDRDPFLFIDVCGKRIYLAHWW